MNFFTSSSSEITNLVWKSLIKFPWSSLKNWKFLWVNCRIKYIFCITATAVSFIHGLVAPLYWWYLCIAQSISCTGKKGSRGRTEENFAWCSASIRQSSIILFFVSIVQPPGLPPPGHLSLQTGGQLPWLHITYLLYSILCFVVFIREWLRYQMHHVKKSKSQSWWFERW